MRGKLTTAALLGCAFAAAAGGTALVNAATDTTTPPPKVQRVDASLTAKFAALRQAPAASAADRKTQDSKVLDDTGINADLARTASTLGDDTALLTPSKTGLCVGTEKLGVLTCGNVDNALAGQVVGSVICSPHVPTDKVEVLGTFPDEVKTLNATLSDGTTTTYPVESNVFARQFSKSAPVPLTLSFAINGVQQKTTTSLPPKGDLDCG